MIVSEDTFALIGKALFNIQRVEFVLYGIVSHLGHLDVAKKDKIFANITAKDFLSDDPEKESLRKATLGRIYGVFGDKLLLSNVAFETFLKERNFFVHDFFRFMSRNRDKKIIHKRLSEFIELSELIEKALRGLLSELMESSAKKEGRESEFQLKPEDEINRRYYKAFVALYMHAKKEISLPMLDGTSSS